MKTRDLVQRASGGAPVSQNSTACGSHYSGLMPTHATCQARSTLLEPNALEESAAELAPRRHRTEARGMAFLPAFGALG